MSTIWAISDLHLEESANRRLIEESVPMPGAVLLVPGDVCNSLATFEWGMRELSSRFELVVWAPGNHELRTDVANGDRLTGEARYKELVKICRGYGVLTPEDPFARWRVGGKLRTLAPLFILYDFSFAPAGIDESEAVRWALNEGVTTPDESMINPAPFASIPDWCRARADMTLARLQELPTNGNAILLNHFPLHRALLRLKPPPAFAIWCGTQITERWPLSVWSDTVVYGHLHWRDRTTFSNVTHIEVSLGYTQERSADATLSSLLCQIA